LRKEGRPASFDGEAAPAGPGSGLFSDLGLFRDLQSVVDFDAAMSRSLLNRGQ